MNRKNIFSTALPPRWGHTALLVFRVLAGIFLLTHGWPKLQRLLSGDEIQFIDPFGLGPTVSFFLIMFAEVVCSLLVIIGLATRLAAIPPVIGMATAVLVAHANDPFSGKEKALLFLLIFAFLIVFGAGKYSVDKVLEGRR